MNLQSFASGLRGFTLGEQSSSRVARSRGTSDYNRGVRGEQNRLALARRLTSALIRNIGRNFFQEGTLGAVRFDGERNDKGMPSGDEAAADAHRIFAEFFYPHALQVDTHGRKNRDVQDGQQSLRKVFIQREVERHPPEAEVHYAGALYGLVRENGVRIRAGHGNSFGFAGNGVDTLLFGCGRKCRTGSL